MRRTGIALALLLALLLAVAARAESGDMPEIQFQPRLTPPPTAEPTAEPTPEPTATPRALPTLALPARMLGDAVEGDGVEKGTAPVLRSGVRRGEVRALEVRDSLSGAPQTAWDVSEAGNGGVLAWMEGDTLVLAGEGGVTAPENAERLFAGYRNLESVRFNGCFYTAGTRSMRRMFYRCERLEALDLTGFDTSAVENFEQMFKQCSSLRTLSVGPGFVLIRTEALADGFLFTDCPGDLRVLTGAGEQTPRAWKLSVTVVPGGAEGGDAATTQWVRGALEALGYLEGGADAGEALARFQRDAGLDASGAADAGTLRALAGVAQLASAAEG